MKKIFALLLFIFIVNLLFAQKQLKKPIPKQILPLPEVLVDSIIHKNLISAGRNQLHLMIEREQNKLDLYDGIIDQNLNLNNNDRHSTMITDFYFHKTKKTIAYIENNDFDDFGKRKYLGKVLENIKNFNFDFRNSKPDIEYYNTLWENTYQVIKGIKTNTLEAYVKNNISKPLYTLAPLFDTNKLATQALMQGIADMYPEVLIKKVRDIKNQEVEDILVARVAPKFPKIILNFATSTAIENTIVRRNKDPYVKSIITIADKCKSPMKAIYFIEELNANKISIENINKITENDNDYFKKLIDIRQKYFDSNLKKSLDKELTYQSSLYVTKMNELHEASEAIRFKSIENFNPNEIYYTIVYGGDDLYTSSFLGCYNRLTAKMKPRTGAEFLSNINKDKFRIFLRLCANYNTLAPFLATMKDAEKKSLMKDFVTGLDATTEGDLEGATDVANSFASIKDSNLVQEVIKQIRTNKDNAQEQNNKNGFKIYDILNTMFTYNNDMLTEKLGIPPISVMPYKNLTNDSGVVVQQVFFYGDEDGKGVFNSYQNSFPADTWKITKEKQWITIQSKKGKPVVIYANIPFDEPKDEEAQNALKDFLNSNAIFPTIIIHRGHSYHLANTLESINSNHKVVILGACGAYQNLSAVLDRSEDAQIVSTKQIGTGKINAQIIRDFNALLLAGKDIDWVQMWKELGKQFSSGELKDRFDDYVPPYKNLGALFLKAYRINKNEE